ncbi:MAG: AmmeMemoRadiSam system protein A [Caldimicrobium sp.]
MVSLKEWKYLFNLVREVLKRAFEKKPLINLPPSRDEYPHLYEKRGVFVTLLKKGALRGCMGSLFPEHPLYEEIVEVALNSAFKDPRFPPLEEKELSEVEIEISLLTPMKRAKPEDIEVGKHGIYIKKGFYRGILLPQVAVEYNWDKETFLKHTCLKAGLPEDCYLDPEVEIYIFTAEIFRERDLM